MYLVLTHVPGESYRRWLRSLLLNLCYAFQALINALVCWIFCGFCRAADESQDCVLLIVDTVQSGIQFQRGIADAWLKVGCTVHSVMICLLCFYQFVLVFVDVCVFLSLSLLLLCVGMVVCVCVCASLFFVCVSLCVFISVCVYLWAT